MKRSPQLKTLIFLYKMVGSNAVAIVHRSTTCMQSSFAAFAALFLWRFPPSPPSLHCLAEICTTTGHQPDPSGDLNAGSAETKPRTTLLAFLGTLIFSPFRPPDSPVGVPEGHAFPWWGAPAEAVREMGSNHSQPIRLRPHLPGSTQAHVPWQATEASLYTAAFEGMSWLVSFGCTNCNGSAVFKHDFLIATLQPVAADFLLPKQKNALKLRKASETVKSKNMISIWRDATQIQASAMCTTLLTVVVVVWVICVMCPKLPLLRANTKHSGLPMFSVTSRKTPHLFHNSSQKKQFWNSFEDRGMLQLVVNGIHRGTTAASGKQELSAAVPFSFWNDLNLLKRRLWRKPKFQVFRLANPIEE